MDFSGRVLLLTGASGGIGGAIARVFHGAGASVVLADLFEEHAFSLAQALDPSQERITTLHYDAADPVDAETAVSICLERFGRLDFLVPAAAIYEDCEFTSMSDAFWHRTISVNLDGIFYICRRAVPVMAHGGAIVMIASDAAHTAPSIGHAPYGASKGGVLALSHALARELAPEIRVNAVSPGTIETPMVESLLKKSGAALLKAIPMKRYGHPEEVADAVAFLCSRAATYITGQAIHVNGGSHIGG